MNKYRALIWLIPALLIIGACGPDPVKESKKKDAAEAAQQQAEVNLLTDASRGVNELDSRLRKALVFQDGMIMIHNQPTYGSYTVPATIQWAVQCGLGLTVSFSALLVEIPMISAQGQRCICLGLPFRQRRATA
jgi:hypothetical protein